MAASKGGCGHECPPHLRYLVGMPVQRYIVSLRLIIAAALLIWRVSAQTPSLPALHDRAAGLLNVALTDKNPDTRKQAVQALSLAATSEPYLSQVEGMLADKDVEVRLATVTSIVDLKNKRTIGALKNALNDDVPEVSFAAAKALWALQDPAGRDALVAVLSGETKIASGFLTRQKREALRMFQTPKTLFTFALMQGIGMAPIPGVGQGVSSLQGILSDPGVSGRAASALLLANDKSPEVLTALRDALADKDWSVRAAAVHALALRNNPAFAADLTPLFDDKKEAVRLRAAAGWLRLESIKPAAAKPPAKKQ
jgi:HEAT repeat protein